MPRFDRIVVGVDGSDCSVEVSSGTDIQALLTEVHALVPVDTARL
jgi:hypothetical protein